MVLVFISLSNCNIFKNIFSNLTFQSDFSVIAV